MPRLSSFLYFGLYFGLSAGVLAVLGGAWPAHAASPVVVELFTSEGCSSCPPADAFLGELARNRPDVIPLDFHVTYWNRLGWADPFSLDAATTRQDRYAALFGATEVYTPEMVIDGRTGVVGSDRRTVRARIASEEAGAPTPVSLRLRHAGAGLTASVGAATGAGSLLLVGLDPSHDTPVGGGENSGRTLHEVNVVRSVLTLGRWNGRPITIGVPRPAGSEAALLLQGDDGRVLAAATAR